MGAIYVTLMNGLMLIIIGFEAVSSTACSVCFLPCYNIARSPSLDAVPLGLGSQTNFCCLPSVWCFGTAAHMDEDEAVGGLWGRKCEHTSHYFQNCGGGPLLSSLTEGESK